MVYHIGPRKINEFIPGGGTIWSFPIFFAFDKNYTYYFLHKNRADKPELFEQGVIYSVFLNVRDPKYLGEKMHHFSALDVLEYSSHDGVVGVEAGTGAVDVTDVED